MKRFLFCLFLFLFSFNVFAVIESDSMNIFAVTTSGEGVEAQLELKIIPGNGKIFTSIDPLIGTSTQTTQKTAVNVAKKYFNKVNNYDYFFEINSNVSEVTGPSAGAAMVLLTTSMLLDKPLPKNVSITGTITEEGFIGVVGGIYAKTKKASESGIDLFLIPFGEAMQTVKLDSGVSRINLIDFGPKELGIKVLEVKNIDEAIKYAFTDIEEIDVNVSVEQPLPEFVPEPINIPDYLQPFKKITENELNKTESIISKAKTNLSNTRLDDASVIALLMQILDDAEKTFSKAQGLNESNYLYSAANYSFLAKINSSVVSMVAENPSFLNQDSIELNKLILDLEKQINELEKKLNENYPAEKFEWFVTAQQRLTYAKNYVERLKSVQTIVVGGSKYDVQSIELTRIQDYIFAKSWFEIAEAFYAESSSNNLIESIDFFSTSMDSLIFNSKELISHKSESEKKDIMRRIDSAKTQKELNWFLGSLFDAASAYGLILTDSITSTDSTELKNELNSRINSLKNKINNSKKEFLWAELYLAHAEFFLKSGEFYLNKELGGNAVDSFKSGLSIIFLAEEVFNASNQVHEFMQVKPELIISREEFEIKTISQNLNNYDSFSIQSILNKPYSLLTFLIAFILVLSLIALLAESYRFERREKKRIVSEIHHVKQLIRSLDDAFANGKVKEEHYKNKLTEYSSELIKLRRELDELGNAKKIEANKKYEKISLKNSLKTRLNALEKHYKEGLIDSKDYETQKKEFQEKLDSMNKWSYKKTNLDETNNSKSFFSTKEIEKELNKEKKSFKEKDSKNKLIKEKKHLNKK